MMVFRMPRGRVALAMGVLALLAVARPADALVIPGSGVDTGNGVNDVAPANDPGFHHVLRRGDSGTSAGSAVYLGDGWVLTANHVGTGSVTTSNGTTISRDTNVGVIRLQNPLGGNTDLKMYRLENHPALSGLSALPISSISPLLNDHVVMVGSGVLRGSSQMNVRDGVGPPIQGFEWLDVNDNEATDLTDRGLRWGENNVSLVGEIIDLGQGDVHAFRTTFDQDGLTHEAQAADKDSGSAVYLLRNGVWELAGVPLYVSGQGGQGDRTAAFGNQSIMADLSFYRDQIMAVIPEPGSLVLLGAGGLMLLRRRRFPAAL